jgi:DNA-binding NtrC family response regulator
VLVVDDEEGVREGLFRALRKLGLRPDTTADLASARASLAASDYDCVLLDVRLPDGEGLELLADMRAGRVRAVPVVVATSFDESDYTIRAMRLGAHDYLTKPFDLPHLRAVVLDAVRSRALERSVQQVPAGGSANGLVGKTPAMRDVWKAIGRAAATDAPVLITGETGTGKEVVAREIHRHSSRGDRPFVAVNLAGLAPALLESELFGHERGAFTGAVESRIGRVEAAEGGTLFLDEIGDLDTALQTKLLRLLQDRAFERVGGNRRREANVRFMAATHRPVRPGAADARLRPDLYYRLAVLEIDVPPLRERRDDIPLLVRHGLELCGARGISDEALATLAQGEWPGNVRELLHVVQRATALAAGEVIDTRHLPQPTPRAVALARALALTLEGLALREAVALVERTMVTLALERTGGNRSRAANLLGIGRPLLYAKIREHEIAVDRSAAEASSTPGDTDEA